MAITLNSTLQDTVVDDVVDAVDSGSSDANGDFVIKDGGGVILVTIELDNPAFGASSSGTASASGTPKTGTAGNTGTAATFEFRDRDNSTVFSGTVTASGGGGDVEMSSTSITSGDTVELSSFDLNGP